MDAALLDAIARRHDLQLILQFGSTVAGRTHARSDLDIAVLSRAGLTFAAQLELMADLQAASNERAVDLVVLDHADPLLLEKVVSACRLLHGAPRRLAELKMLAWRRYQDHRRFLAMERAYVERFLQERR